MRAEAGQGRSIGGSKLDLSCMRAGAGLAPASKQVIADWIGRVGAQLPSLGFAPSGESSYEISVRVLFGV